MSSILVTGGAGFIGSHLVEALVARGHRVRVVDALVPQAHGSEALAPRYLPEGVVFIRGDVTDAEAWRRALADVEVVFHEAAEVGVAQSMDESVRYVEAQEARDVLGYRPGVRFEDGVADLARWAAQERSEDRVGLAVRELEARGLAR